MKCNDDGANVKAFAPVFMLARSSERSARIAALMPEPDSYSVHAFFTLDRLSFAPQWVKHIKRALP
jgi:hypothetical protein